MLPLHRLHVNRCDAYAARRCSARNACPCPRESAVLPPTVTHGTPPSRCFSPSRVAGRSRPARPRSSPPRCARQAPPSTSRVMAHRRRDGAAFAHPVPVQAHISHGTAKSRLQCFLYKRPARRLHRGPQLPSYRPIRLCRRDIAPEHEYTLVLITPKCDLPLATFCLALHSEASLQGLTEHTIHRTWGCGLLWITLLAPLRLPVARGAPDGHPATRRAPPTTAHHTAYTGYEVIPIGG
jgi:hypothetical protein